MPHVRLSARSQSDLSRLHTFLASKDINAAKRAIDFGASGYLALYRFESALDTVTILAIKHQREDDYK